MDHPVRRRAERLLREMGRQAEGKADHIVEPEAAAERLNMAFDSPLTEEALGRLMESGWSRATWSGPSTRRWAPPSAPTGLPRRGSPGPRNCALCRTAHIHPIV
jgi:hypothetical protein